MFPGGGAAGGKAPSAERCRKCNFVLFSNSKSVRFLVPRYLMYLHCSAGVGVIIRDISGHSRVPVSLVILALIKYFKLKTLNSRKKELLIYSC